MSEESQWRRCSACKGPIRFASTYWVCNVSTCNRKRTGLVFCTVSCWEVHLPGANHREAWAVERSAPADAAAAAAESEGRPRRRRVAPTPAEAKGGGAPSEILVVASRLKDYIRERSGFNTSERVLAPLSDIVREAADRAIESARRDGRQTVLDRDL